MKTAKFFDSYAQGFNAIYGTKNNLWNRLINKLFRKSMKLRYLQTLEECSNIEGKSVVDIGCGPGHFGITLAQNGAKQILGVDFAQGMIDLAKENAQKAQVANKCEFILADFMEHPFEQKFNYTIVMGFMDYISDPKKIIDRVLEITTEKAMFSFPADGGFLAWQRKKRYKSKCDLFMYNKTQLEKLFAKVEKVDIKQLSRDYFVTVYLQESQ